MERKLNSETLYFRQVAGVVPVEWRVDANPVNFETAVVEMESRVEAILTGEAPELVWLLEHPPLYTAGTSAKPEDLKKSDKFPVFKTGRGGQYTYHGPGQRVAYVMLNLKERNPDVRIFVRVLEEWLIRTMNQFNIVGERRKDRIGVWVKRPDKGKHSEEKLAAVGIRIRKWISFHGISINVEPNLNHYDGIVPCGVANHGVTSFVDLGYPITIHEVDSVLRAEFEKLFGPTVLTD